MWNRSAETLAPFQRTGGVEYEGVLGEGLARLRLMTTDLAAATDQLSGEIGSDLTSLGNAAANPFFNAVRDRVNDVAHERLSSGSTSWVSAYGTTGNIAADTTAEWITGTCPVMTERNRFYLPSAAMNRAISSSVLK